MRKMVPTILTAGLCTAGVFAFGPAKRLTAGIHALKPDHMICLVPDMTKVEAMPVSIMPLEERSVGGSFEWPPMDEMELPLLKRLPEKLHQSPLFKKEPERLYKAPLPGKPWPKK